MATPRSCPLKSHKALKAQVNKLEQVQARYALALELCADDHADKFLLEADQMLDAMERPERHTFYSLEELREKLGIAADEVTDCGH